MNECFQTGDLNPRPIRTAQNTSRRRLKHCATMGPHWSEKRQKELVSAYSPRTEIKNPIGATSPPKFYETAYAASYLRPNFNEDLHRSLSISVQTMSAEQ